MPVSAKSHANARRHAIAHAGSPLVATASVPLTLEKYTGPFSIGSFEVEDAYRFYVVAFAVVVVPFCFFNFQVRSGALCL